MATLQGKLGKVGVGANTVAEIDNWTADIQRAELQKTAFLDDFERYDTGLGSWNGSFGGRHDQTDTNGQVALMNAVLNGTSLTLRLYVDGTHYYSGSVIITKYTPKATVKDLVTADFTFRGTGAPTYT